MKQIRDQLYNYIPVSPLEVELLKRPEILRLHRVLQNSTIFATYPCNRASRFSHSLGVMHVAGQMYKFLIYNSNGDFVKRVHKTLRDLVRKLSPIGYDDLKSCRKYLINSYSRVGGKGEFFLTQGWSVGGEVGKEEAHSNGELESDEELEFHLYYNTVNNILFQAIRLAALVHDIGHLPFSHVLEFSLNDLCYGTLLKASNQEVSANIEKLTDRYLTVIAKRTISSDATSESAKKAGILKGELHEMIGTVLINEIPPEIRGERAVEDIFWRVSLQAAIRILTVDQLGHFESGPFNIQAKDEKSRQLLEWYALGSIINGQVDCDRLDYLRRDPLNSGVTELGDFDSIKIISNITPVKVNLKEDLNIDVEGDFFVPGFDRRALSALTDYFHDRMRHYRWLVNHHNVVRTDLALTRLIIKLADIYENNKGGLIGKYLVENGFQKLWTWDNLTKSYRYLDDAWLDTLLQGLYQKIQDATLPKDEYECRLFLEILYDRKTENMKPVWKGIDGFVPFANGFTRGFYQRYSKKPLSFITTKPELQNLDFLSDNEATNIYQYLRQLWTDGRLENRVNGTQTGDLLKNVSQ